MSIQSERELENNLIKDLQALNYKFKEIENETELLENFKEVFEFHNFKQLQKAGIKELSKREFDKILNILNESSVFECARRLRDKFSLELDNGEKVWLEFLNMDDWCQNEFQVSHQITNEGVYKNRYDVTLLINGLPLVQIELKRRGLELKEAFHQTNRYQKHSYGAGAGLFRYIQIFVISNGVNTKYYTNNKKQSFEQTFFWTDRENKHITRLEEFAKVFLEPCHLSKMITRYTVLNETYKILMVLRPYQYFACEAIIEKVENNSTNGYIWHTTGSGKTLTSFKTSQILTRLSQVDKVLFVVDRKDLDYQTQKEFDSFSKGSVDGTDNTKILVKQFEDTNRKLIITTIQKLNTAVSKQRHLKIMEKLKNKKIIFIFDECHRSQFGETHKRITNFFTNYQMFGFTGTPIFAENNHISKTTRDLFGDCLHKYVITDAIRDENVLRFSVEYIGKYKEKSNTSLDIKVKDIDTKELLEDKKRLEKIVDYVLAYHSTKTHNKEFNSIFCVSSVEMLIKYYEIFKVKNSKLKIATIFSYGTNEEDLDANGILDEVDFNAEPIRVNRHSREKLDEFIVDYNKMFGTSFSTSEFYNYYKDIAKKTKEKQVDILLVVNMFLTGFDSPTLNTLYVDKNLKYHSLIQAFSRTNRILNERKSQGNIVCFRNLKKETDDAITLFSNKDAKEIVLIDSFESYLKKFNEVFEKLIQLVPSVDCVNDLQTDEAKFGFVKIFRDLIRLKNVLESFYDFDISKTEIDVQTFEDYKSKYLDIYNSIIRPGKEKVSILDDVDFELELIKKDEINLDYILALLANLKDKGEEFVEAQKKVIFGLVDSDIELRSKKELIKKFIEEYLGNIKDIDLINEEWSKFMTEEKLKEFEKFCEEENLDLKKFENLVSDYLYTNKEPTNTEIEKVCLDGKIPSLLKRKSFMELVKDKIKEFTKIFEN